MDRSQIIALEEEVMALTAKLKKLRVEADFASDDRNHCGTLWLNLNELQRVCKSAGLHLNNRFCFEAGHGL